MFLLEILIFKWLTARRLYKSFGVKGLNQIRMFLAIVVTINVGIVLCTVHLLALIPTPF
jgi:hypothetical protein